MESEYLSVLVVVALLVMFVIIMRLYRQHRLRHYEVVARDVKKGHRWYMVDLFSQPTYDNVDKTAIIHGAQCDSCGICVDDTNMKKADRTIPCKPLSTQEDIMVHHWVQGNLPLCQKCWVCGRDCGVQPELTDQRCCWCHRAVHDECRPRTTVCDLGPHCRLIIPPNCIRLQWVGLRGRKHLIVKSVSKPAIPNWSPLIVIANCKSGSNEGEALLRRFRSILNPTQVMDLHGRQPQSALEWCHLLPDTTCRVLVCGGDGTISWVLNSIEDLKLQTQPQVAILPLGTGNDLARVLGWGEGHSGDIDIEEILSSVETAKPVKLDRWNVKISHEKQFGIPMPRKDKVMNNYLSIGVDALVTLNFHKRRESLPWLFAHRVINKFCYFTYGTKDVLERECKDLHKKLKVELDGREIELPELESIVVLNISSWGGGCRPWQLAGDNDNFCPPRYDDQLLEVIGVYSSFHIAQMQMGLASPVRLGQARHVKITLSGGNAPLQVDGEPWEQHPAEIEISYRSQVSMLACRQHAQ